MLPFLPPPWSFLLFCLDFWCCCLGAFFLVSWVALLLFIFSLGRLPVFVLCLAGGGCIMVVGLVCHVFVLSGTIRICLVRCVWLAGAVSGFVCVWVVWCCFLLCAPVAFILPYGTGL